MLLISELFKSEAAGPKDGSAACFIVPGEMLLQINVKKYRG